MILSYRLEAMIETGTEVERDMSTVEQFLGMGRDTAVFESLF